MCVGENIGENRIPETFFHTAAHTGWHAYIYATLLKARPAAPQ
jgi:hypothetical protein